MFRANKFARINPSTYTSTNRLTQQTATGRVSRPSSGQNDHPDTIASTSKKEDTKKNETSQNRASLSKRRKNKKKKSKASNSETVDDGFDESACGATAWTAKNEFHSTEENGSTINVRESHKSSSRYEETSEEKEKSSAADAFSGLVKEKVDVAKTLNVTTREVSEFTDDHYTGKTTNGNRDKPNSQYVSVVEDDTFSTLSDPSALKIMKRTIGLDALPQWIQDKKEAVRTEATACELKDKVPENVDGDESLDTLLNQEQIKKRSIGSDALPQRIQNKKEAVRTEAAACEEIITKRYSETQKDKVPENVDRNESLDTLLKQEQVKKRSIGSDALPQRIQEKKEAVRTGAATCKKITTKQNRETPKIPEKVDRNESLDTLLKQEQRNLACISHLFYGLGLDALRNLFMEINPNWSNKPSDADGFDKGVLCFYDEKEEEVFNRGNIKEWDFSLITSVLLYSNVCTPEIKKRRDHGNALRQLKSCRNKLLGHNCTDRMSDDEFSYYWPILSANFITLGADPKKVKELPSKTDELARAADYYRDRVMEDKEKYDYLVKQLKTLLENKPTHGAKSHATTVPDVQAAECQWYDWLQFLKEVDTFDTLKTQYILVTDSVPVQELECYSMLKRVAWKLVLDLDPLSEEEGFYHEFTSKEGQSCLVSMFTPLELNQSACTIKSLMRKINPNKIQWFFVNGRSGDIVDGCKDLSVSGLDASSLKGINNFLACCSEPDIFDKMKKVIVLILPFNDKRAAHLQDTLVKVFSRLTEHFSQFSQLKFVSINNNLNWLRSIDDKLEIEEFHMSPQILRWGFTELLDASAHRKLCMPTSHAGAPAILDSNQHLFIKEHLEVLYRGCEDLLSSTDSTCEEEKQQEIFLEQLRKSFLSGNLITFPSLFDNHDARRQIEEDIRNHVQRFLVQRLPKSVIVEIRHSPGTGGSTIARRVLWDLHRDHPCALIDMSDHPYFDEDNSFVNEIADRIALLEEICNTTPLILIDGKQSGVVESLSNKLQRVLQGSGKRIVILRCLRGSKASPREMVESSQIHKFHVNVRLEESVADLRQFKAKYKEYLDSVDKSFTQVSGLCRVFHFPLLAMMEDFRPKLEKIIEDTFDELGGIQQEIAVVVAFLQKYSYLPTPALLLYEAFKEHIHVPAKYVTYEDIKELFSDSLVNLMIPTKVRPSTVENPPESYTFQHPLVADLILARVKKQQKRGLFDVLNTFLEFQIYQQETLRTLLFELFLYNKKGAIDHEKLKFSILFEELQKINSDRAAEAFLKAAEKLNDPVMYGNAARFYARKNQPSFSKAKELIDHAIQLHGSKLKGVPRYKNLCHTKGVVLQLELTNMIKTGEIKDLEGLQINASNALEALHEARDFPPTHPHPLIGEVEVYLQCFKWIMNNKCEGDTETTLTFLTNMAPPFFRTCISESFRLLDIVDTIVQSVPYQGDHEKTKRLSNQLRLSLMNTCRSQYSRTTMRKAGGDIVQACKALCTSKNFPQSSVLELKRLQVHFILTHYQSIETGGGLKQADLAYLLDLLEELVFQCSEFNFAQHLIRVCMLVTGRQCYTLEKGLAVCESWLKTSVHNCMPHFYQMAIFFLGILDGNAVELMPMYIQAREKCQEKSQNDLRRFNPLIYIRKGENGMARLISRNTLLLKETDYTPGNYEKVSRFWQVESRKTLLEFKGRIKVRQSRGKPKSDYYIVLPQGNLELYVGKPAEIGKAEVNFTPDALVYFVVSFNLQGPVANGITFAPFNSSNKEQ